MTQDQQRALAARLSREAQAEAKRVNAAADSWRQIEPPPPDGVLTLFFDKHAASVSSCFFVDWMVGGKFCGNRYHTATHWMPLPHPPSDTGAETP